MAKVRCYFLSLTGGSLRFSRGRRQVLQFGHRLVQLLFFILGCAFETCRPLHRAVRRIDRDFKVRANKRAGQVSIVDPQPDDMRSIPVRKLRLLEGAKTRRVRRAQLLRYRRFRSLEIFSFVRAASQGNGHREENEQQGWLHMSGLHRFGIMIGTIAWGDEQQTLSTSKCADLARSVQEE